MRKSGASGGAGTISVTAFVGAGVDRCVGTGVGGVREARIGSSEAHPALKITPTEITNRKTRAMITDQWVCATQPSKV